MPFHEVDVPATGGMLRLAVAGPATGNNSRPSLPAGSAPPVLAVHGITASHRAWAPVARHLGEDALLLAPDLRGRGHSATLPPPYGLDAHVDDLVGILDHQGIDRAVLAGHSMGAYIVARFAAAHPQRTAGVVLVDGGIPLPVPADADLDAVLETVLGPALARLSMEFASLDEYRAFWRRHPALGPRWSADIEAYVDYDLRPADPSGPERGSHLPAWRSRVVEEAVRTDGRDVLDAAPARKALMSISAPLVLLRAPRGLFDEPNPLLPEAAVAEARSLRPDLGDVVIDDTNHYLITMGAREAAVVAATLERMARGLAPEIG